MTFYLNVFSRGSKIYLKEIDRNGKRNRAVVNYRPYLFSRAGRDVTDTKYRNLQGQPVVKIDFESGYEARQYIEQYSGIEGFEIYGMTDWQYPFINDTYPGQITYDSAKINRMSIDIETDSEDGFPDVETADKHITMITISQDRHFYVFSLKDYVPHMENITFHRAKDEIDLLKAFLSTVELLDPDVLTGWAIENFDVPYIIRRIKRVLGDDQVKRLSPWGIIDERRIKGMYGKETSVFTIAGLSVIDYLPLYKKFTFTTRDNYKLDTIASIELGTSKVDYSEYGSLDNLWKKNPQLYAEYNVIDVELIDKLEDKLKLLELLYSVSYDAKTNFIDSFATVKPWDVMIHNHLMDKGIVIPTSRRNHTKEDYGGGHVKEPITGKHKWVVSFDLTSLYPMIILGCNISPEKYRGKVEFDIDEVSLLNSIPDGMDAFMKDNKVTITPNRCAWDMTSQGFIGEIIEMKFRQRKEAKDKMLVLKDQAEDLTRAGATKQEIDRVLDEALRMDMVQLAKKISMNSLYGALANVANRWYMLESAEAITSVGRHVIRWTEKKVNEWLNAALKTQDVDFVIYSDTDSIYVNFADVVSKRFPSGATDTEITDFLATFASKKVEPFLASIYDELTTRLNWYRNTAKMKREAISSSGIFVSPKRYALSVLDNEGVRYAEPRLKVTGLEAVRSSTPASARTAIKTSLDLLLSSTESEYHDFVSGYEELFPTLPLDEIATNTSINGMGKYEHPQTIYEKGTPYHVKSALLFNDYIKRKGLTRTVECIRDGDKVMMIPLTKGNPIGADYLATKVPLDGDLAHLRSYIDYWRQFDKVFVEPMGRITKLLGFGPKRVPTLDNLFEF